MVVAALLLAACAKASRPGVVGATVEFAGKIDVKGDVDAWAPGPAHDLMPVNTWVRVGGIEAFSYLDSSEGLSAQWHDGGVVHIRRLRWAPAGLEVLTDRPAPAWLDGYGPQPPAGAPHGAWRADPALEHRFHPDYPDDVRVLVGVADPTPLVEIVWVRLLMCEGLRCTVSLLNQPDQVPGLALGSLLAVDFEGIAADRLPVAAPVGATPNHALVSLAAESPQLAGVLADEVAWVPDFDVPAAARLVPIGVWGVCGGTYAGTFVGPAGPVAAELRPQDGSLTVFARALTWLPRGWRTLDAAEVQRLGLPATLSLADLPPQPAPGSLWGRWRVAPETAWIFMDSDPDVARVLVEDGAGGLTLGLLKVDACEGARCVGRLVEAAGIHAVGAALEVRTTRSDATPDGVSLPLAWARGGAMPVRAQRP
jgi:hypothetical protein